MQIQNVWIITDKKRNLIATGKHGEQQLDFCNKLDKSFRVFLTKEKAQNGIKASSFWYNRDVEEYLKNEYPELPTVRYWHTQENIRLILEPVEIAITEK